MNYREKALVFECDGDSLIGILSAPVGVVATRAILIVVGGPQYRVGSHRLFTLLARDLASRGHATLRFDHRGVGDSTGAMRSFLDLNDDIGSAIEALFAELPALRSVVIWGLCDAATAAVLYCNRDARVTGLAIANPETRSAQRAAVTVLKHYYLAQLLSAQFWSRLVRGKIGVAGSIKSLMTIFRGAMRSDDNDTHAADPGASSLPDRITEGLEEFSGRTLLVLSGSDLTARAFCDAVCSSRRWRKLLANGRCLVHELPAANHTFARSDWQQELTEVTADWLDSW